MMTGKNKTILVMFFSLLFAVTVLVLPLSDTVWAVGSDEDSEGELAHKKIELLKEPDAPEEDLDGTGIHKNPETFQKNLILTPDQKEYTITEMEKVISEIIDPEMSDLEKYYTLAIWANKRVQYDWDFWSGGYDFDYYSHQWDSYGAMKEDEKSVCVGIAIFYSNLCHAAGLPCRFVRLKPEYLDHTINYIPNISGHDYYVDVTENVFLMSGESSGSFEPYVDREFAGIPEDGCTDTSFDYYFADDPEDAEEDRMLTSSTIKDFYDVPFEVWYEEYALHQNTEKTFGAEYVEKGSGTPGTHYASYTDRNYPSDFTAQPDIWFLDDFYENPAEIKGKILDKEFDKQLLNVSGVKKNYDCVIDGETLSDETIADLKTAITQDITSVKYFPSSENGAVVAKSVALENGTDYTMNFSHYDAEKNTAEFTLAGEGAYSGEYTIQVKLNSSAVSEPPAPKRGLVYDGSQQELVAPGVAEDGEMQYALGTKDEPTGAFSADIPTAADAGKYYVWYRVVGAEGHNDTEPQLLEKRVSIAPMKLNLIMQDKTVKVGESVTISPKLDVEGIPAAFLFESFDEDIATVTEDGVVKGLKKGIATIFISAEVEEAGSNYEAPDGDVVTVYVAEDISGAKVALSKSAFTYNNKVQKPSIKTVKGLKLEAGTDYTVKWSAASPKNVGAYTVTITGKGIYTGVTKATYKINPKGTKIKKVKRLKKAKRTIKVKWKKQKTKMAKSRITGYQIQLATDKKFTKNKKTVTVKGYKKTSKKIKKLKGGKKYYVKIRTYKTVGGKKYYSGWSKVKTVKTRK